jgi:antitoxin (DNA-binding transcriptional repressor) of toxin-antitoxin stability system
LLAEIEAGDACEGIIITRRGEPVARLVPEPRHLAIKSSFHGLRGIEERVKQLGGKKSFSEMPGGGFCFMVQLPLPAATLASAPPERLET